MEKILHLLRCFEISIITTYSKYDEMIEILRTSARKKYPWGAYEAFYLAIGNFE